MIQRFIINFQEARQRDVKFLKGEFLERNACSKLTEIISHLNDRSENFQIVLQVIDEHSPLDAGSMPDAVHSIIQSLSRRELEVFEMALKGLSSEQIAERLCISIQTVKSHRKKIVSKAGVRKIEEIKDWLIIRKF